jgi:hypothetical protein
VDVGIAYPDYGYYYRPQTRVTVIDITDHAAPSILSTHTFHGSMASSRMIDRVMHLVLVNYPVDYYGMVPLGMPNASFQDVQLDTLMPKFQTMTADGMVEGDVVKWDRFYAPVDPDGFGVTAVIRLDVDDPGEFNAVGIAAEPHIIYASTEALYVTDTAYTWWGDARETTDIYKFKYTESGIELTAAGTVPGRIEDQYRMGESNGYLRVATSTSQRFSMETGDELEAAGNHVFVLAEQEGALAVVGAIRNIAPGEQIRAARFMGDRGILVTFRQIDPFFTLDLSEPTNPRIVAELKVPGFSTFMVPMDEDHMLTVGQYVPIEGPAVPDGIQISIFDISDFANPVRSHNVIIAGQSTSSEAVWNPKAFTYFPERDLLALPMEIYNYSSWWQEWDFVRTEDGQEIAAADVANIDDIVEDESFTGLYVYHVTPENGFDLLGRMSTRDEANAYYYYNAFTRGVFMGDNVYAVTDNVVVGSPVSDVGSTPWKLTIGEQDNYYYDDVVYSEEIIEGVVVDSETVFDLFMDDFGLMGD